MNSDKTSIIIRRGDPYKIVQVTPPDHITLKYYAHRYNISIPQLLHNMIGLYVAYKDGEYGNIITKLREDRRILALAIKQYRLRYGPLKGIGDIEGDKERANRPK